MFDLDNMIPHAKSAKLLLEIIKSINQEQIEIEELKLKANMDSLVFEESLSYLLKNGDIFEIKKGYIKLLDYHPKKNGESKMPSNEEKFIFYSKEVDRTKYTIKSIELKGLDALHDFDKERGVDWAIARLKEDLNYFQGKLNSLVEEYPYLKESKLL